MANIEERVDKLETKFNTLEQQVSNVTTKLDMFIDESRAARERQDADMREIRTEMSSLASSFRSMNITVIIGIAAMVIAVLLK
ncbi:MAG: hypothetical protein IJ563_07540 [Selenomonadaceae bacterium]|nr:hypothetical protein [Selenomonadaceae bacterium]MBR1859579.1 hypothetical protein [Selenomonadaceae bacterium]